MYESLSYGHDAIRRAVGLVHHITMVTAYEDEPYRPLSSHGRLASDTQTHAQKITAESHAHTPDTGAVADTGGGHDAVAGDGNDTTAAAAAGRGGGGSGDDAATVALLLLLVMVLVAMMMMPVVVVVLLLLLLVVVVVTVVMV